MERSIAIDIMRLCFRGQGIEKRRASLPQHDRDRVVALSICMESRLRQELRRRADVKNTVQSDHSGRIEVVLQAIDGYH